MSSLQWVVVIGAAFNTLGTVAIIGKERKPITPGQACFTVAANIVVAVLALTVLAP